MTRVAAWVAAGVLVVVLVGAGLYVARDDRPSRAVVTATRDQPSTVDVTSTVTIAIGPPPSTPPTTVQSTTTLPKAAVDVLNALGSTTTTRRTTSTTRPPAPTTTVTTPTTVAPPTTTTTTIPQYTVTVVNNHPHAFVVLINGRSFPLNPGQTVDAVTLPVSPRGDSIQVRLADDASCGVFDSGTIFQPAGRYRVTVVVGPGMCGSFPSPFIEIARLP